MLKKTLLSAVLAFFYGILVLNLFFSDFYFWKIIIMLILFSIINCFFIVEKFKNDNYQIITRFIALILIFSAILFYSSLPEVATTIIINTILVSIISDIYIKRIKLTNTKQDIFKLMILFVILIFFESSNLKKIMFNIPVGHYKMIPLLNIALFTNFLKIHILITFSKKNNLKMKYEFSTKKIMIYILYFLLGLIMLKLNSIVIAGKMNINFSKTILPEFLAWLLKISILEELFYRGIMYELMDEKLKLNKFFIITLTSFLFMSLHLLNFNNLLSFSTMKKLLSIFFGGVIYVLIRIKSNNPYISILLHAAQNTF